MIVPGCIVDGANQASTSTQTKQVGRWADYSQGSK